MDTDITAGSETDIYENQNSLSQKIILSDLISFVRRKETIEEINRFMTSGCGIPINFSIKESTPGTWQLFSKLIGDGTGNVDDLFDELLIELLNIFPVMKKNT